MSTLVATSRRRNLLVTRTVNQLNLIESLERRTLMSVSASTLLGPVTTGQVKTYQVLDNSVVKGTFTVTTEPATTFNGNTAGDSRTIIVSNTSTNTYTSDSYDTTTDAGIISYGSSSQSTNASGGVLSSTTDVLSPAELLAPTTINAGTVYTTTFSDTATSTYLGQEGSSVTTTSETDTFELVSETLTPITVPAGTFNAYQVLTTSAVTSSGSTTNGSATEYFAPGTGLIEIDVTTSGSTSQEVLSSNTGGGGGGGGGGGTTTGNVTPVVVKSTLPAFVVAGGTSKGSTSVSLTNSTAATIKESVTTQVYGSLDGAIDSASVLLGSVTKTVSIKAGLSTSIAVPIKSVPASLAGTYTLLAKTTDVAGSTSSTTGPTLTAAAPFVSFISESLVSNLTGSIVSGAKTKDTATLTLTNNGNIPSTGMTTIKLDVTPDGTFASGTAIRTVTQAIVIQPGKSKTVKFPLMSLPDVANGTYEVVAQITDPKGNVTTVATTTSASLAQPFLTLTPTLSVITPGAKGTGSVTLTVTNNGNITPAAASQVVLYASATEGLSGATQLVTQKASLLIKPGATKTIKFKLTAAQVTSITAAGNLVVAVTDPLGGVLTASTGA